MKKTSQHLVYPNNMHQYQSRQQYKGLFSILFCNHVSSVKYRKQEQILKILNTMNRRSQFYNLLKYQYQGTTPRLATRATTSWILPRCMVQLQTDPGKKVKNAKISTNKARYILRRICFFPISLSLMVNEPSENTLELQNLECTDSWSWTSSCLETDDCNVLVYKK